MITQDINVNFITSPFCYWNNLFSDDELNKILDVVRLNDMQDSTIVDGEFDSTRQSKVNFHKRNENTSWIFDKMNYIIDRTNSEYYKFDLWGYDYFQYSEYNSNDSGHYDWHQDISFNKVEHLSRKLSLVLLLNGPTTDFSGGDFEVHFGNNNHGSPIHFQKGGVVLFPSFINHRVSPVTSGTRKSIVTWVTGPKFK